MAGRGEVTGLSRASQHARRLPSLASSCRRISTDGRDASSGPTAGDDRRVTEQAGPVLQRPIGCDDGDGLLVAMYEHLRELVARLGRQLG